MRVCLLTPEFLPTWGGIGTYTYNLARGLRDRAEVHVVTASGQAQAAVPEGVRLHLLPSSGGAPGSLGLRFPLAVFRRLPALARAHGFDVIHANHAYMSDILARTRRLDPALAATVHTTLGTQIEGTLAAGGSSRRRGSERTVARWRPLFRRIERRYLRRTPALIFVSRWVRDSAVSGYRLRPRVSAVIPNGVDLRAIQAAAEPPFPLPPWEGPTFLFAGRLLALKGIETLFRAVARSDPRVRVLLAGPGDPTPWRDLANRLGLGPRRCEFLGPVPHGSMPSLYRAVDGVVLPSLAESCPMVALEAMACGTPLIAASAGGVLEIVEDGETGWLFLAGDAEALAARIRDVLSDPAATRRVCDRARAWIEGHASLERMSDRTLRFYEETVAGVAS